MTPRTHALLPMALFVAAATLHGAGTDRRLIDAARSGRLDTVRALLMQRVDVNATQPDGATALHWAADRDRLDIADALLKAGARVDARNDYGVTPLALAAINGSAPMIQRLLTAGAAANATLPTGETVLMTAVHTGKIDAVRTLLRHGAEVNAREIVKQQTALMWALWKGDDDIARALIEAGADIAAPSASGFTPVMFAAREGNVEMTRLLLAKGASANGRTVDGHSPLHIAVIRGHVPVAKLLLDHGADPNAADAGFTPLHWAAGTWESGHTHDYLFNETAVNTSYELSVLAGIPNRDEKHDLIKALLARGANVNARLTKAPTRFGHTLFKNEFMPDATPFLLATVTGDVPTMALLLANGADPSIPAIRNTTPLISAAGIYRTERETRTPEAAALEATAMMVALGADINEPNEAGNTPLHAATMAGLDTVVTYLVEHGAAINARNVKGETALKLTRGFIDRDLLYMRPSTAVVLEKLGATE